MNLSPPPLSHLELGKWASFYRNMSHNRYWEWVDMPQILATFQDRHVSTLEIKIEVSRGVINFRTNGSNVSDLCPANFRPYSKRTTTSWILTLFSPSATFLTHSLNLQSPCRWLQIHFRWSPVPCYSTLNCRNIEVFPDLWEPANTILKRWSLVTSTIHSVFCSAPFSLYYYTQPSDLISS